MMKRKTTEPVPAVQRKWAYHLTNIDNLRSIASEGLLPKPKSGSFGYLSPEAYDGKPKLFLLPILSGVGMAGFLEEWWHGERSKIAVLRMPFSAIVNPLASAEADYARCEIWTHHKVAPTDLMYRKLVQKDWFKLTDALTR